MVAELEQCTNTHAARNQTERERAGGGGYVRVYVCMCVRGGWGVGEGGHVGSDNSTGAEKGLSWRGGGGKGGKKKRKFKLKKRE